MVSKDHIKTHGFITLNTFYEGTILMVTIFSHRHHKHAEMRPLKYVYMPCFQGLTCRPRFMFSWWRQAANMLTFTPLCHIFGVLTLQLCVSTLNTTRWHYVMSSCTLTSVFIRLLQPRHICCITWTFLLLLINHFLNTFPKFSVKKGICFSFHRQCHFNERHLH